MLMYVSQVHIIRHVDLHRMATARFRHHVRLVQLGLGKGPEILNNAGMDLWNLRQAYGLLRRPHRCRGMDLLLGIRCPTICDLVHVLRATHDGFHHPHGCDAHT